jgi:hypothetical protein
MEGMSMRIKTSKFCSTNGCIGVGFDEKSSYSSTNGGCVSVGAFGKSTFSAYNGNCVEIGAFRKSSSSFSNGNCVEAGAETRTRCQGGECVEAGAEHKSSYSTANGQCVAVMAGDEGCEHSVKVYDTKNRTIEPVEFGLGAWQEFINQVKGGEFPADATVTEYRIGHLVFNYDEWDAFVLGCKHIEDDGLGEFDLSPELAAELEASKAVA